jgi:hypothetical protein
MKTVRVVSTSLLPLTALSLGCSSAPADSSVDTNDDGSVAASSTTQSKLGVARWVTREDGAKTFLDGVDADGNVVVWFERELRTLPSGDIAGQITSAVGSQATLSFLIHPDHTVTIVKNELPENAAIVEAAQRAVDDLAASSGSASGGDLTAKDLTSGSGGGIVTGTPSMLVKSGRTTANAVAQCGGPSCQSTLVTASAAWTSTLGW